MKQSRAQPACCSVLSHPIKIGPDKLCGPVPRRVSTQNVTRPSVQPLPARTSVESANLTPASAWSPAAQPLPARTSAEGAVLTPAPARSPAMKALLSCELLHADIGKLTVVFHVAETRQEQEDCLSKVLLSVVANAPVSECRLRGAELPVLPNIGAGPDREGHEAAPRHCAALAAAPHAPASRLPGRTGPVQRCDRCACWLFACRVGKVFPKAA